MEVINRTPHPHAFNGLQCAHEVDLDHPCEQCAAEHAPKPPAPIQAGDMVRLKSGGPRMTVLHVKDDKAVVAWFPENPDAHPNLQQAPGMPVSALVKSAP